MLYNELVAKLKKKHFHTFVNDKLVVIEDAHILEIQYVSHDSVIATLHTDMRDNSPISTEVFHNETFENAYRVIKKMFKIPLGESNTYRVDAINRVTDAEGLEDKVTVINGCYVKIGDDYIKVSVVSTDEFQVPYDIVCTRINLGSVTKSMGLSEVVEFLEKFK